MGDKRPMAADGTFRFRSRDGEPKSLLEELHEGITGLKERLTAADRLIGRLTEDRDKWKGLALGGENLPGGFRGRVHKSFESKQPWEFFRLDAVEVWWWEVWGNGIRREGADRWPSEAAARDDMTRWAKIEAEKDELP